MKVYYKGDSGIKEPVDIEGNPIKEGDLLTWDYGDNYIYGIETKEGKDSTPFYVVKVNDKGGYFAESIKPCGEPFFDGENKYFFLHDFRFKYTKKITPPTP